MRLLLIHTGGTIGMRRTDLGFAPLPGLLDSALAKIDTAAHIELAVLNPLIDSAHASFADWNRIAGTIVAAHDRCDGFVVTHGTDTMAFTAAALCFALQGLARPVVLTGSMVPLGLPGSDGMGNLTAAIQAAQTAPAGIWLQFAGHRFHGARLRKANSVAADAFAASPAGKAPVHEGKSLIHHAFDRPNLTIQSMAPGASGAALDAALSVCDGAVLRVFGAGTLPNDPVTAQALRRAHDRGVAMIAVAQSPEGGIHLGTYAAGNLLLDCGVIDGGDITAEAAFAKLAHALSRPRAEQADLLARNLCGEFG